jgi:hypothetical protein
MNAAQFKRGAQDIANRAPEFPQQKKCHLRYLRREPWWEELLLNNGLNWVVAHVRVWAATEQFGRDPRERLTWQRVVPPCGPFVLDEIHAVHRSQLS